MMITILDQDQQDLCVCVKLKEGKRKAEGNHRESQRQAKGNLKEN